MKTKMIEYTVIIRKAPDGYYIANCPLLPEAHAQGKTYDECLANIKEVITLCLEFRKERGEEIPIEKDSQKVTVTV
jgi:predicted RNase H-like HicB family nuclease